MSSCAQHASLHTPLGAEEGGEECMYCLLLHENQELMRQLKDKEQRIRLLEERRHESFFFLLMFFCKLYQSSCARMRKIQETIVKNNNYNIKVREERSPYSTPFTPRDTSPVMEIGNKNSNSSTISNNIDNTDSSMSSTNNSTTNNPSNNSKYGNTNAIVSSQKIESTSDSDNDTESVIQELSSSSSSSSSSSPSTPTTPGTPQPSYFPPPSIIANTHDQSESSLIKHFHHIIYENALDPVLVHDTEGWIVDANGAAVALTGYPIEELRSKNIRELESRYVEPDPAILEQLMNGAAFRIYGEHISKQGRVFPVEVHISLANVEGKNYVVGLFRDVTEILRAKTLEKEYEVAQATNRAKNIFLATMSHELTTPLYGVMASLDILRRSSLTDKQVDLVDCATNSAIILKGIVNDILDLSVLELGMFRVAKDPYSFTRCAASSFEIFSDMARFQGLSFKWLHDGVEVVRRFAQTGSPHLPNTRQVELASVPPLNVIGDSKRMQQVLINLLSNAVKFTPRGGSVVLRTQVTSDDEKSVKLRIDVADTGIGLAPEQLKRIFEKFTQAEEGFTRKYSGTGLGLYISNKLILLMGGKLSVKSEVRKGAVFTVSIHLLKHSGDLPTSDHPEVEVELPPIVAAMAAYHHFGKKRQKDKKRTRPRTGGGLEIEKKLSKVDALFGPLEWGEDSEKESNAENESKGVKDGGEKGGEGRGSEGRRGESKGRKKGRGGKLGDGGDDNSLTGNSAEPSSRGEEENEMQTKVGDVLSVLLVEDNLVNQKVGKQLLRTLGIRDIDIANDGWHCLEMIKTRRLDKNKRMYNVILMDKQMPFLDGMEATRVIRQQEVREGHVRVVIIALTADCRAGVDQEALNAGMDDYLTKPVRARSLYNVFLKHGLLSTPP